MSNDTSIASSFRVRIYSENTNDYSVTFSENYIRHLQQENNTLATLQQVLNVMNHFYDEDNDENDFYYLLENRILQQTLEESLHNYKYNERKPHININTDTIKYEDIKTPDKYTSCSICISNFKKNNYISILECSHLFHEKCINEWTKYKSECPICRINIKTKKI